MLRWHTNEAPLKDRVDAIANGERICCWRANDQSNYAIIYAVFSDLYHNPHVHQILISLFQKKFNVKCKQAWLLHNTSWCGAQPVQDLK